MYTHLFGPVPSRRLGMSLGVDLVPHKVCSLNCVYCECGPTTRLTDQRKEYVLLEEITAELEDFFEHHPDPDYITFSGAGEPTLNSRIGEVLQLIKHHRPGLPVAVLTNGTLFRDPRVRQEIQRADLVLPSLDAATDAALRKINRPLRQFTVGEYLEGLVSFRKEYSGEMWLEVLILPGYNDDRENLLALKEAFQRIAPDRIQLNTLDRPGAVKGLRAATAGELNRIIRLWELPNVEIIAPVTDRKKTVAYRSDMQETILETISRRPCTLEDLHRILGLHVNEINKYLGVLEEEGKIKVTPLERGNFYQVKNP